jgi:glycosyltransferase involved in cell wall biosynthesis
MPCFNYGRFLGEAIDSVLAQSYQNWELIVINDGSTDNTKEILCDFKDTRIQAIHIENAGVSNARNTGLKAAKGDYIAFLDADDVWDSDKLDVQVRALRENPNADFVFANFSRFDSNTDSKYGDFFSYCPNIQAIVKRNPQNLIFSLGKNSFKKLISHSEMPWYPTNNMVRASAIKNLKFPTTLKIGEDLHFFLRVWSESQAVFINRKLSALRVHGNNASNATYSHNMLVADIFTEFLVVVRKNNERIELKRAIARLHKSAGIRAYRLRKHKQASKHLLLSIEFNLFQVKAPIALMLNAALRLQATIKKAS